MFRKLNLVKCFLVLALVLLVGSPVVWAGQNQAREQRLTEKLQQDVRHQLVMLPYFSVFDWLQAEVQPDGTVVLNGQVAQPTLKRDAESSIKRLESATAVVNNIEVLPLSTSDDDLRVMLYRNIYRFDSPLVKYAIQPVGPIHILVKNGNVTLMGLVASKMDSQLAYMLARQVPGAFSVKNELRVENATPIS